MSGTNITDLGRTGTNDQIGVSVAPAAVTPGVGNLSINLVTMAGSTISSQAQSDLQYAVQYLDSRIHDNATINIGVSIANMGQDGTFGLGGPALLYPVALSQAEHYIAANAPSLGSVYLPASLPAGVDGSVFVSTSEEKAWGIDPQGQFPSLDGTIVLNSYYFNSPRFDTANYSTVASSVPAGQFDFVGLALHEITHAMGRISGNDAKVSGQAGGYIFTPLNLFRFDQAGSLQVSGANLGGGSYSAATPYFSLNDGQTSVEQFGGVNHADWSTAQSANDAFNLISPSGPATLTPNDTLVMQAVGFDMTTPTGVSSPQPATITATLAAGVSTLLGAGSYVLTAQASDQIYTGAGDDTISCATPGSDTIGASAGSGSVYAYDQTGYAGKITFVAGSASSVLIDNNGSVNFVGAAGSATVTGGTAGSNTINGGAGAIFATGGGDNSLVIARSAQANYLFAGVGTETLIATNTTGTNLFDVNQGAGGDVMSSSGTGTQYFFVSGGTSSILGSTTTGANNIFFAGGVAGGSAVVENFGSITGSINCTNNVTIQNVENAVYNGGAAALVTLSDGTRLTLLGVQTTNLSYSVGGTVVT